VLHGELEIMTSADGHVALNSAGQRTPEMLACLNAALALAGYRVLESTAQPGEWMVSGQHKSVRFQDGLVLHGAAKQLNLPPEGLTSIAVSLGGRGGSGGGGGGNRGRGGGHGQGWRGGGGGGAPIRTQHQQQPRIRQPLPGDAPMAIAAQGGHPPSTKMAPQGGAGAQGVFSRLGPRAAPGGGRRYNPYGHIEDTTGGG
jgi:hypothetical protein